MTHSGRSAGRMLPHRAGRAVTLAVCALLATTGANLLAAPAHAATPVGAGFTLTAGDLSFILKQIKIAERHRRAYIGQDPNIAPNPDPTGDPWYCQSLVGKAADQIPDRLTAYGLRTVDGGCNNLFAGREKFAAADVPFPRLATADYKPAEGRPAKFFGPNDPGTAGSSYAQKLAGNTVYDTQPRLISNLIVDQTVSNPAAVDAALHPVRTQDHTPSATPCDANGLPKDCTPPNETLFIPNITTDVGLSPPYNSMFTFFGQFFDHGVDQTVKGGGTVFVPLKADDPLITKGPDGIAGTGDEVKPQNAFMVLTRAQNQPGTDGNLGTSDDVTDSTNTDSPWVDNSQTYTSHAAHQVFLREYAMTPGPDGLPGNTDDQPVSTGNLLGGLPAGQTYLNSPDGRDGLSTWASVKKQAAEKLGLLLTDADVTNVPMIYTDPYGQFIAGPKGLPQYVTKAGLVEGDLANPVPVPSDVYHFDTPFLTDIAHNADPSPVDTNNDGVPDTAPVPDADSTANADFTKQPKGTYDDELLNAHFVCGDGRCNENIALSTIHQVFHSEHNRLVEDIKNVLLHDTSATGQAALLQWQLATGAGGWNGERLFQAARYVNEMEYQHTVFEEFARKVQPAVRPFHVYSPDINPAVKAEFAHAVYRFGHSMLDDTVARATVDASGNRVDNSLPLLTAFLNPPELFDNGKGGVYTPREAAGAIVMGSSDQTGNEIDEFVTQVLRNNLLGLPLDLATLNLTRARDAGVPRLNEFRRELYLKTGDSQLVPYTSWADFGQHLKHPASLVNFVAAYGTHPSITSATTLDAKRLAARAIVDPLPGDVPPDDAFDFLYGNGAWADADGKPSTGLDDVDLWIGGLAEVTNLNGGLLGPTFNYVFQNQLEDLQDGDRLYYLNRTPGMNLRTQLEGNSFGELIMRNTDGTSTLKADAFATADCKFQLKNLDGTPAGFSASGSTVADDTTTTDCDESKLLSRAPDGTLSYKSTNTVDPPGINGQSVYNGRDDVTPDRVKGGNDNDTIWGNKGDDVIDALGGDDVVLGGDGDDKITDLDGADILKGGPGDDVVDAGPGGDITIGGDGRDVLSGGSGDNETFGGPGDDFIMAGQGADVVFGDGGDDWIEGGTGQDLLQGDHGAPFFDDPAEPQPGNDVFVGQPGENDYDAEGGDDLMAQNAAIDRNAGAAGFDWAFHQYDTVGADDDMEINNNLAGLPLQVVVNRDRWGETEADSGSKFDDVIRGTTVAPALVGGAGFSGCDVLDPAGVARIAGLDRLVKTFPTDLGTVVRNSAAGYCPQVGLNGDGIPGLGTVWGEGDILLGAGGSDLLEGRANDDIIDGDHQLRVRISVRTNPADPATEIAWTDLIEGVNKKQGGSFGAGTTATTTLQQALTKGIVKASQLVVVREIVGPNEEPMGADARTGLASDCGSAAPANCDVAMFSFPPQNYLIAQNADGSTMVRQLGVAGGGGGGVGGGGGGGGAGATDGTDTLWNIEVLRFCTSRDLVTKQCLAWVDQPAPQPLAVPPAPTVTGATPADSAVTVFFTPNGGAPFVAFQVDALNGGAVVWSTSVSGTSLSATVTGLTNGQPYTFVVRAVNDAGPGADSAPYGPVSPAGVAAAPTIQSVTLDGPTTFTITWTAPVTDGGSPVTDYQVEGDNFGLPEFFTLVGGTQTSWTFDGLLPDSEYTFYVRAVNATGLSDPSAPSDILVTPPAATVPPAPTIGTATAGDGTATVDWTPAGDGGSPLTGYEVQVIESVSGTVVDTQPADAAATSLVVTGLTNGTAYEFQVRASNVIGAGDWSASSNSVTPVAPTVPGAPTIGTATRGNASATVTWSAPADDGGSPILRYEVQVRKAGTSTMVGAMRTTADASTTLVVTGLTNGTAYDFRVRAVNAVGKGGWSARSNAVTPATVPAAPKIGTATSGSSGGSITATAKWTAPTSTGGSAITGYKVIALRMSSTASNATVLETITSSTRAASARSYSMTLPVKGTYRFQVVAINAVGTSDRSARSNAVTGQ